MVFRRLRGYAQRMRSNSFSNAGTGANWGMGSSGCNGPVYYAELNEPPEVFCGFSAPPRS